jgi:two-component system OmpR family response regulator
VRPRHPPEGSRANRTGPRATQDRVAFVLRDRVASFPRTASLSFSVGSRRLGIAPQAQGTVRLAAILSVLSGFSRDTLIARGDPRHITRTRLDISPQAGQHRNEMPDSDTTHRVLVVDDEPNLVEVVSMALRFQGFEVETATTGREALAAVTAFKPHLMVLDVMLPDMEGFDVANRLGAQRTGVPIIFLTARDSTEDKIRGLSGGGDDYMTKPFSLEELVARIRTILRRTGHATPESGRLLFADLEMDEESREVSRAGKPIELTATEYRLLRYLMLNPRRVMTRAQLLDHVWNYDFGGDGRVLETYISYLRKKLDVHGPSLIRTVRGVGYALQAPRS